MVKQWGIEIIKIITKQYGSNPLTNIIEHCLIEQTLYCNKTIKLIKKGYSPFHPPSFR